MGTADGVWSLGGDVGTADGVWGLGDDVGTADGVCGVARVCARSLSRYKRGLVPGSECFLNSSHLLLLPHIPGAMLDSKPGYRNRRGQASPPRV